MKKKSYLNSNTQLFTMMKDRFANYVI